MDTTSPTNLDAAAAVRRRKIRRRRTISTLLVIVLIAGAVSGFMLFKKSHQPDPLKGMVTAKVGQATIIQKISATGNVNAQTGAQVNIGSQVSGRIKNLYVDVDSHVQAGQVIAVLDSPDMQAQFDQSKAALNAAHETLNQQLSGVGYQQITTKSDIQKAEASLATVQATYNQDAQTAKAQVQAAQAAINQAQATYENALTFLKRQKQLLTKGYIAVQDADNAQTSANVASAQLDSAKQNLVLIQTKTSTALETDQAAIHNANAVVAAAHAETAQNTIKQQQVAGARAAVKQAEANVAYQQAQFDKTIIRTPISGTITTLSAQQGETIAAGLSAPTLVTVVNLNRLQVEAFVDETDIGGVHIGQPVTVTVDAFPNKQFTGHVEKIASTGTLQQNVVTYNTTVALDNTGGLLKPSMSATVSIVVSQHEDVVAVPIEAVKYVGTAPVVYVVNQGKVVPRKVETGISDDTNTEILHGVREGETIVLAGYQPNSGAPRMGLFGPGGGHGGGAGGGGGRGGSGSH